MEQPLANQFTEMLTDLTPEGGTGKAYSELTREQRETVDEMLGGGERRDEYNALVMMGKAINQVSKVLSGFTSSDDIEINHDPASSATMMTLRKKQEEAMGGADLGTAEKEYMVYQRKANDDQDNPQYGFDFVRSVASTEE